MPMYDYVCDVCREATTRIYGSLDAAEDDEPIHCEKPACQGVLTRQFPQARFRVRGGTPKHHR